MKKVFITGITGQDGAYLSQLLLEQGDVEIYGGIRRVSNPNLGRLEYLGIADKITLVPFELLEYENIRSTLESLRPDEIYNLAAQSFVDLSFKQPLFTVDATGMGPLRILEAMRSLKLNCKFYQASSSEMYGDVREIPQTELTPFNPVSPYAVAKNFAHHISRNYRLAYGMFNVCGILYNHESPLRGREFVTRRITSTIAKMSETKSGTLQLGNLNAKRDWGYAKNYMEAALLMMAHPLPDDFVIATGETHTIREFVEKAFEVFHIPIEWVGDGVDEKGLNKKNGQVMVEVNPKQFRPSDVNLLIGDATKAQQVLGWTPTMTFEHLVEMMTKADYDLIKSGRTYGY